LRGEFNIDRYLDQQVVQSSNWQAS